MVRSNYALLLDFTYLGDIIVIIFLTVNGFNDYYGRWADLYLNYCKGNYSEYSDKGINC